MNLKFRNLKKDEILCRVAFTLEAGCQLLLYKDARCDMNILDETVGPIGWQKKFSLLGDFLVCSVGINAGAIDSTRGITGANEWIWKSDIGSSTEIESEKGYASDSFKRACFNWGIGRELYTAPRIWVQSNRCNIRQRGGGRYACYDLFLVEAVVIEDKKIKKLAIYNMDLNKRAFLFEG